MAGPEWTQLADLLIARRKELSRALDADWRFRRRFADAHNLDYRTVSDLEVGRRDNYEALTYRRIESAYRWETGSVEAVLGGGAPMPEPIVPTDEIGDVGPGGQRVLVEHVRVGEFEAHLTAAAEVAEAMSDEERDEARRRTIAKLRELLVDLDLQV
ncbi:hypothetical protein [Sphaerimonospora thailandensis]|uniref:Uncharacterized protein n=1 Tax=Sphaerimonospora thailandensis TaxID=795644 RepID=A0A8J3VZ97_9ACTN|nr:hypothetical protein [Sphaerimonospora thailandensis]GIH70277.1 hypothetical protein Mth01_25300 [Sphaerimonospora thailandensis]